MKEKFETRDKIIILAVLIVVGIIINTVTPVSLKTSVIEATNSSVSCGKTDQSILSALFIENNQENENSCLFIGCGSAF